MANGGILIRKTVILAAIALAMLFFSASAPAAAPPPSAEPTPEPSGWWSEWTRDMDHNGIDDILDNQLLSQDSFGVFLDYSQRPTVADIDRLEGLGFGVKYQYKYIDTVSLMDVTYNDIETLGALPGVVMVEADLGIKIHIDSAKPTVGYDEAFKDYGYDGEGITIAIIDTGIDGNHAGLDDMDDNPNTNDPKIVAFYDVVGSPEVTNGTTTPFDNHGHGTHCAGIAAGTGAPDYKYVGLAPEAKLVGVGIGDDTGTMADAITGIEWVIDNKEKYDISIVSMSFGANRNFPGITNDGNSAVSRVSDTAVDRGLVVLASAGNKGPTPRSISPPGDASKVITIGNVYDSHELNPSSSRGPVGSFRDSYIKPDVAAPGTDIYSAEKGTEDGYVSITGTSMSTPFVAGVAALILQANPGLGTTRVKEILTETADGNTVRAFQSSPNNDYGYGVINIPEALEEAVGEVKIDIPDVKITSPAEGAVVEGNITVSGTVTVNNASITSVQIRIGSGSFQDVSGIYDWTYLWDTSTSQNGETAIFARATSNKGATGTDDIVVDVNKPSTEPVPEPPDEPEPPADNGTEPPENETDDPLNDDDTTPPKDDRFLPIPGFEPATLILAAAVSVLILRRRKEDI